MNVVCIEVRVTRDAELKYLQSGTAVCSVAVASDDGFGDKKKTSFFDCTIFGKFAESIDSHLVKGQQVIVFGRMEQRTWQTQDGQKRSAWGVVVDQLRMCGKSGNGQQSQSPREQAEEFPDFDTPDITDPFADQ